MSNTSIQLPTEIWSRIQLFNSHPCADMIRKLKDDLASDYPEEYDPDAFVQNLTLEVLNWLPSSPFHHQHAIFYKPQH